MKKYLLSVLCSCLSVCAVAGDAPAENNLMLHSCVIVSSAVDGFKGDPVCVINGGGLVPRPHRNPKWDDFDGIAPVSSGDGLLGPIPVIFLPYDYYKINATGCNLQVVRNELVPFGGGLVPRWPPRIGSIIPGASVLSRDSGNASGALRSNATPVMSGDVNDDGKVDVQDITALNGYVLGETPEGFKIEHANVNGDDLIDVGDVTALTHYVLNGSWPSME